jgi:hypothetical protein
MSSTRVALLPAAMTLESGNVNYSGTLECVGDAIGLL